MANKKNNKGTKGNGFFLVVALGAVILIILLLVSVFGGRVVSYESSRATPALMALEISRNFKILDITENSFRARDLISNEDVSIIVPPSARVELLSGQAARIGDIAILQKYVVTSVGLVAQTMQILPAPPEDLPEQSLLEKPNE